MTEPNSPSSESKAKETSKTNQDSGQARKRSRQRGGRRQSNSGKSSQSGPKRGERDARSKNSGDHGEKSRSGSSKQGGSRGGNQASKRGGKKSAQRGNSGKNAKSASTKTRQSANKKKQASPSKPSLLDRILLALGLKKPESAPKSARQKEIRRKTQQEAARQTKLDAQEPKLPKPKAPISKRLYIGNLSYDATEQDVKELFKGCGSVRSVDISYNGKTHRSKGFGFVRMNTSEESERAIEILHDQFFMGRKMVVREAEQREQLNSESSASDQQV